MAHIYILEYRLELKVLEKFYPSKFDSQCIQHKMIERDILW
jgi:hypothetical protein